MSFRRQLRVWRFKVNLLYAPHALIEIQAERNGMPGAATGAEGKHAVAPHAAWPAKKAF